MGEKQDKAARENETSLRDEILSKNGGRMTFDLEQAVQEANRDVPEAVSSELYNAALEAIDDHEAARRFNDDHPAILPDRLYQALKDWTKMEYRKSRERAAELAQGEK
jgi:hypothetical protein